MNILIVSALAALVSGILGILLVRSSLACRKLRAENASLRHAHEPPVPVARHAPVPPPGPAAEPGADHGEMDLGIGLRMTGGKQKLFLKFLIDFREKYRDFPTRAQNFITQGKSADLERLAHTLKGNAAMLGFKAVSGASAALESVARGAVLGSPADLADPAVNPVQSDQAVQADQTVALQRVIQTLGPAFLSIRLALEGLTEDASPCAPSVTEGLDHAKTPENLEILLSRALDFLARGEYGAQAILASIEKTWDVSACRKSFGRICAAVDNGDYDEACQDLGELIESRKIT